MAVRVIEFPGSTRYLQITAKRAEAIRVSPRGIFAGVRTRQGVLAIRCRHCECALIGPECTTGRIETLLNFQKEIGRAHV